MITTTRQVTLRLPKLLYDNIKTVAKRRKTSVNRLARQELERLAETEMAAQLQAAYEVLGEDKGDAEFFIAAQSEALKIGE